MVKPSAANNTSSTMPVSPVSRSFPSAPPVALSERESSKSSSSSQYPQEAEARWPPYRYPSSGSAKRLAPGSRRGERSGPRYRRSSGPG